MKKTWIALAALTILSFSGSAFAVDVPAGLIVTRGGLEWAWVSPCSPVDPSCGNTPLTMHDGWGIASTGDYLASFTNNFDLFTAFDGALGNGFNKCASAFFDSGFSHCDSENVYSPLNPSIDVSIWNAPTTGAWSENIGNDSFSEVFVVRRAAVPEPASLILLGTGLVAVLVSRKRSA